VLAYLRLYMHTFNHTIGLGTTKQHANGSTFKTPLPMSYHYSGEAAAHHAGAGDCLECHDCRQLVPSAGMVVYPFGLLCEECHDEERDFPKLRIGDQVQCKGTIAKVTAISETDGIWPDSGDDVTLCDWSECKGRNIAVDLDNGKWAWGYQISPFTPKRERKDALEDMPYDRLTETDLNRLAAIHEEIHTEGRVRRPWPVNPHD